MSRDNPDPQLMLDRAYEIAKKMAVDNEGPASIALLGIALTKIAKFSFFSTKLCKNNGGIDDAQEYANFGVDITEKVIVSTMVKDQNAHERLREIFEAGVTAERAP